METIIVRLRQVERRLRWQRSLLWASKGVWAGLALAIAVALASRAAPLLSLNQQLIVAAWLAATSVALPIVVSTARRHRLLDVAKIVDRRAGLRERISTAVELAGIGSVSSLAAAQLEDAQLASRDVDPKMIVPYRFPGKSWLVSLGLVAALAASFILPNPMQDVLADRADTVQSIKAERAKIEQVKKEVLETAEAGSPERREEMLQAIDQLSKDLRSSSLSKEEAVSRISAAEEKLSRLIDRALPSERLGLEELAAGLRNLSKSGLSTPSGANSGPGQLSDDLSRVAGALDRMNGSERNAAADVLSSTAAGLSSSNPGLATQVERVAEALRAGDDTMVREALDRVAVDLDELDRRLADQRAAERALSQLQASRSAIASSGAGRSSSFVRSTQGGSTSGGRIAGDGRNGPTSGQGQGSGNQDGSNGQAGSSGGGQQSGAGQGSGGSGSQGTGSGAPSGSGNVAGTNAPTAPGATSSGTGQPATGRTGTTGVGGYEPVFTPGGLDSQGKPLFLPGSPDAGENESQSVVTQPGAGSSVVPYGQVFESYSAAAARSIEGSYIPGGLKDYVRGYFTSLEPGSEKDP